MAFNGTPPITLTSLLRQGGRNSFLPEAFQRPLVRPQQHFPSRDIGNRGILTNDPDVGPFRSIDPDIGPIRRFDPGQRVTPAVQSASAPVSAPNTGILRGRPTSDPNVGQRVTPQVNTPLLDQSFFQNMSLAQLFTLLMPLLQGNFSNPNIGSLHGGRF